MNPQPAIRDSHTTTPNSDFSNGDRALIIGGGVAGLAAALRLGQKRRWRPLIIEREDRPGGLARSLSFKGVSSDLGPHRIHTELPEVQALIDEVAAPSLYTVRRTSHIYLRGKYLRYPPAPLEIAARLGPLHVARFMSSFAWGRLNPAPGPETYESLMHRAFGKALYDFLIRPYTAKTWKADPAELHADTARVRVSAGSLAKMVTGLVRRETKGKETSLREFRYVRGGAETLVRHLWDHAHRNGAELMTESAVESLVLDDSGEKLTALRWRPASAAPAGRPLQSDCGLRIEDCGLKEHGPVEERRQPGQEALQSEIRNPQSPGNADLPFGSASSNPQSAIRNPQSEIPGDLFISTVPLPILLGRLLPPTPPLADARAAAAGLRYLDMLFVLLVVGRKVISGDNWLYFPEPHLIFNRAHEAKNFDPAMGPEDRSVICLEITVAPNDPLGRESDDALIAAVSDQIASTGLFRADEIRESFVYRLPYAYPVYTLDYADRLDCVWAGLRRIRNLLTIGRQGLFNHNNMDHSICMGLRAADQLNAAGLPAAIDLWYDHIEAFKRMRIVD